MKLQGEKIYLLPITKADTDNIVRWRNSVRKNFIHQELFTLESHNAWLENMVYTNKVKQFVIYGQEDNKPVGSVFLRDIDHQHDKAEYGIFIGDDSVRGKGYGSEAAALICDYGFQELKLHKIFLRVFGDNEIAIHSYEKAGFVKEALLKDDVKIDSHYRNLVLMAKISWIDRVFD